MSSIRTAMASFYGRELPCPPAVAFGSAHGKLVFARALNAGTLNAFFELAPQFRTQDDPAYCGLSTLTMVLNALHIDPARVWKHPWRYFHEEFLDCCKPLDVVKKEGITMNELICLARCNGAKVESVSADERTNVDALRRAIQDTCRREDCFLVASYSRATLQQSGDGHFSPIAGYDAEEDLALIMDVARFKYPPHWVSVPLLFKAMQQHDAVTNQPRGWAMMQSAAVAPPKLFFLSRRTRKWSTLLEAFKTMATSIEVECERHGAHCRGTGICQQVACRLLDTNAVGALATHLENVGRNFVPSSLEQDTLRLLEQLRASPLHQIIDQLHRTQLKEISFEDSMVTPVDAATMLVFALPSNIWDAIATPACRLEVLQLIDPEQSPEPLRSEIFAIRRQLSSLIDQSCGSGHHSCKDSVF